MIRKYEVFCDDKSVLEQNQAAQALHLHLQSSNCIDENIDEDNNIPHLESDSDDAMPHPLLSNEFTLIV